MADKKSTVVWPEEDAIAKGVATLGPDLEALKAAFNKFAIAMEKLRESVGSSIDEADIDEIKKAHPEIMEGIKDGHEVAARNPLAAIAFAMMGPGQRISSLN